MKILGEGLCTSYVSWRLLKRTRVLLFLPEIYTLFIIKWLFERLHIIIICEQNSHFRTLESKHKNMRILFFSIMNMTWWRRYSQSLLPNVPLCSVIITHLTWSTHSIKRKIRKNKWLLGCIYLLLVCTIMSTDVFLPTYLYLQKHVCLQSEYRVSSFLVCVCAVHWIDLLYRSP